VAKIKKFLDTLVNDLLPRIADKEARVRKNGLVGLGNLRDVWCDSLESSAPAVLATLTSSIEDSITYVAAEALRALTSVLDVVSTQTVHPALINICFRTRPYFESKEDEIREGAFGLFGALTRFGTGNHADNFVDQIHTNIATFVVHTNDVNDAVSNACLKTFKTVATYLKDEKLETALNSSFIGKDAYTSLLVNVVPVLIEQYSNHTQTYLQCCVTYMSSNWGEIRGNSALLAAKLLQNFPIEKKSTIDIDGVVEEILKLLTVKNARVKQRVAKALSYLGSV